MRECIMPPFKECITMISKKLSSIPSVVFFGLNLQPSVALASESSNEMAVQLQTAEDLTPFAVNAGSYVIDPQAGVYCKNGYTKLDLVVDPASRSIVEIFTGPGTINGLPTAGQKVVTVSLTDLYDLPSFPGRKQGRLVVRGREIIEQTSTHDIFAGEFGEWRDGAIYFRFISPTSVMVFTGGFRCAFVRAQ
jgi:hypothetical protein